MESSGSTSSGAAAGTSGGEASSQASQSQAQGTETAAAEIGAEASPGEDGGQEAEAAKKAQPADKKAKLKVKAEGETEEEGAEKKKELPPHKYHERLTKAFPDRKFEKSEDYDTALDEHLTGLEDYREKGKVANQKLISLFESEPAVGETVRDMLAGASYREAIARHYSPEDLTPMEGDPDHEGWKKNTTTRDAKAEERRNFEKSYAENLKASEAELTIFAKERGLDEKGTDTFLGNIDGILERFNNGQITKADLEIMRRGLDYDKDIEAAKQEATIAARNGKITAQRETETDTDGDGMPRPNKTPGAEEVKEGGYLQGLRDRMADRGFIGTER